MKVTTPTLVVTGSSGFVGEKLALVAIREGYEVIGIDFKKSSKLSSNSCRVSIDKFIYWKDTLLSLWNINDVMPPTAEMYWSCLPMGSPKRLISIFRGIYSSRDS